MALYRLELILHDRILAVMQDAGITYEERMTICSKATGKNIHKFDNLTPSDAIAVIDYITSEYPKKRTQSARRPNKATKRRFKEKAFGHEISFER